MLAGFAMGLSKIYEIVLNSDPGLAFLLDTNPEIANLLVATHVFGHVDFFKNNLCFADTNRRMVNDAVAHALRIDAYIERYGLEVVEHFMDIGFALDDTGRRLTVISCLDNLGKGAAGQAVQNLNAMWRLEAQAGLT